MADHVILFSATMVKALLARRKTVTRRISKRWLRVKAGDTLTVKESAWMWCLKKPNGTTAKGRPKFRYVPCEYPEAVLYCADHAAKPTNRLVENPIFVWRYKTGRFMPRW